MNKCFTLLIILFSTFWTFSQVAPNLDISILSIHAQNESASQILLNVGKKLGTNISYNANYLKNNTITIHSDSITLREIIDSLFLKKDLKLRLIGNQLVVYDSPHEQVTSDTCYQTIRGQLIDAFTGQELALASIKELQTNQLTVSNRDGRFLIKAPCDLENIQLEISAMGYRSRFISQPINEEIVLILMEGDYIALKEVLILGVHADQLMEEVLNKICDNYMKQPTRATSFFREAILKNNKLVALSEAVFDVYNHSYISPGRKDQVQLVKGRKYTDHTNFDTVAFKMKGSLRSCFELDVVKHQPYFFSLDSYKDTYEYSFNTVVEYNGRDMYVINFKHKSMAEGLPYEGKMFIDKERKSLVSIEFELSKRSMRNTEKNFIVKKSKNIKTKLQKAYHYVHYTDVDGRLAMNYAYFTSEFKVKRKDSWFSAKYQIIGEYVVNKFQLDDVNRIRSRDAFAAERIFMDEPIEYSDSYWKGINFLPIEKPLINSSEELQKILLVK